MSNLLMAMVTIEGTRPFMWHAFTLGAMTKKKKEQAGTAGNDPEEWKRSVLATLEGQLYVEPFYIFACLRDGARYVKQGRGSLQAHVIATLQVLDKKVLSNRFLPQGLRELPTDPTQPVYLDIRGVKNPTTKARNIRYWVATAPGWQDDVSVFMGCDPGQPGANAECDH